MRERVVVSYREGLLVEHPRRPEWGPGRVLDVRGSKITVYFRDMPGDEPEAAVRTIDTNIIALQRCTTQSDPMLDNLPPFLNGKFETPVRKRVTLEQGIARFHALFPLYFEDPRYLGNGRDSGERLYKLAAHEQFVELLGHGQLTKLLRAGDVDEARRRVLAVESRTNLLAVFEKAAFRDGIRDDSAAMRYMQALARILEEEGIQRQTFERYLAVVEHLPSREGKTDPAKWTIATIVPFLADPKRFMYLKPMVTKDCAARLTFDLKYSTQLNWATYGKLLEMSEFLLGQLRPLGARDYIDVQSFIWVIGGGWD